MAGHRVRFPHGELGTRKGSLEVPVRCIPNTNTFIGTTLWHCRRSMPWSVKFEKGTLEAIFPFVLARESTLQSGGAALEDEED